MHVTLARLYFFYYLCLQNCSSRIINCKLHTIMRKLFSLFVALLATTSLWAEDFSVDGIYYNYLEDNNVEVTYRGNDYDSYDEYYGAVIIPSTVTYNDITYSVTNIGDVAFGECSALTSITIPNSGRALERRRSMVVPLLSL